MNATSKVLQDPQLDLNSAVAAVKSLRTFIESKRDRFEEYEKEGGVKSGTTEYVQRRQRRRNVRLDPLDQPRDTGDTSAQMETTQSEKFRTENFLPVIDRFITALEHRLCAYETISSRFGCLRKLDELSSQEILTAASNLVEVYEGDLDACLGNELVQFADFVNAYQEEQGEDVSRENFMYHLIFKKRVQSSFPNVEIALRMYLVLMISNCSAERSFSKMKLIKNRLRTSMCNDRLFHLSLMSIEADILREINFEDLVNELARKKARKVSLL